MITTVLRYRNTKRGWVVYGPADRVTAGADVQVTKANGEVKSERITSVGRPFQADGQTMIYGYLAEPAPAPARPKRQRIRSSRMSCPTDGNCSSFGNGQSCGADECDGW